MAAIILPFALRRDTSANWTEKNPILLAGQEGYEVDTRKRKVGDGATPWNALLYDVAGGGGSGSVPADLEARIVALEAKIASTPQVYLYNNQTQAYVEATGRVQFFLGGPEDSAQVSPLYDEQRPGMLEVSV